MTNSEVQQLKEGDVVHGSYQGLSSTLSGKTRVLIAKCIPYTVTADARPAKSQTHYEAWAVSAGGGSVVRVTHNGDFHLPSTHATTKGKK